MVNRKRLIIKEDENTSEAEKKDKKTDKKKIGNGKSRRIQIKNIN